MVFIAGEIGLFSYDVFDSYVPGYAILKFIYNVRVFSFDIKNSCLKLVPMLK